MTYVLITRGVFLILSPDELLQGRPMSGSSHQLVAITASTKTRIAGWSHLLRAESIKYVVAPASHQAEQQAPDQVELWVRKADAALARSVLRRSVCYDEPSPS